MSDKCGAPDCEHGEEYLQCNMCLRKTWGALVGEECNMTQPNGKKCSGTFKSTNAK